MRKYRKFRLYENPVPAAHDKHLSILSDGVMRIRNRRIIEIAAHQQILARLPGDDL